MEFDLLKIHSRTPEERLPCLPFSLACWATDNTKSNFVGLNPKAVAEPWSRRSSGQCLWASFPQPICRHCPFSFKLNLGLPSSLSLSSISLLPSFHPYVLTNDRWSVNETANGRAERRACTYTDCCHKLTRHAQAQPSSDTPTSGPVPRFP